MKVVNQELLNRLFIYHDFRAEANAYIAEAITFKVKA